MAPGPPNTAWNSAEESSEGVSTEGVDSMSTLLGLHLDTGNGFEGGLDPGVGVCVCVANGRVQRKKAQPHILKDQACWLQTARSQA